MTRFCYSKKVISTRTLSPRPFGRPKTARIPQLKGAFGRAQPPLNTPFTAKPSTHSNPTSLVDFTGLITFTPELTRAVGQQTWSQGMTAQRTLNAAIARANEILQKAQVAHSGSKCRFDNDVVAISKGLQKLINDPNWVWDLGHNTEGYADTTKYPSDVNGSARSRLNDSGIQSLTSGSFDNHPAGVPIEEILAAYFIHEAFQAYRGDLHAATKCDRYTEDDHDLGPRKEKGPLYWFTRGVLAPYWDSHWGSSLWVPNPGG